MRRSFEQPHALDPPSEMKARQDRGDRSGRALIGRRLVGQVLRQTTRTTGCSTSGAAAAESANRRGQHASGGHAHAERRRWAAVDGSKKHVAAVPNECGPMPSVLEMLRNRPPGRKQLTPAHQPRGGGDTRQIEAAGRCTRASARACCWAVDSLPCALLLLLLPQKLSWVHLCSCSRATAALWGFCAWRATLSELRSPRPIFAGAIECNKHAGRAPIALPSSPDQGGSVLQRLVRRLPPV